jgi:hypothetical protein
MERCVPTVEHSAGMRQTAAHDTIRRAIRRSAVVWRVGTGCGGVGLEHLRSVQCNLVFRNRPISHLFLGEALYSAFKNNSSLTMLNNIYGNPSSTWNTDAQD